MRASRHDPAFIYFRLNGNEVLNSLLHINYLWQIELFNAGLSSISRQNPTEFDFIGQIQ